jgi:two-component system nitrate/nitrite response regulator NarL
MGMSVLGVYTTADGGWRAHASTGPTWCCGFGLPDGSGLELGRHPGGAARDEGRAVTALEDEGPVQDAFKAGFHGYLTKQTETERFEHVLRSIEDGQSVFPQRQFGRNRERSGAELLADQLTTREVEVLQLLAEGATSAQMAEKLDVSPNTVRTHVQGILSKLQVHSRLEAAAFAVRHGLVKPRT